MLSRTSQKQGKKLHQSGINAAQMVCSVQKQAWLTPLAASLPGFVSCLVRHGARDQTLPYRQASSPPLSYIHPQPSFLSHNLVSKSFRGHEQLSMLHSKTQWKLSHPRPLPLRVPPIPVPLLQGPSSQCQGHPSLSKAGNLGSRVY